MRFLVFVLLTSSLAAAAPVPCPQLDGTTKSVRPPQLQAQLKKLRARLKNRALHVLDLPPALAEKRHVLDSLSADNACAADSALVELHAWAEDQKIDEEFINTKLAKLLALVQKAELKPAQKAKADLLAGAAVKDLELNKIPKAASDLNQLAALVTGTSDPWQLPAFPDGASPVATASVPVKRDVNSNDIRDVCPQIVKKNSATGADFSAAWTGLAEVMDARSLRLFDFKDGDELIAEAQKDKESGDLLHATMLVCLLWQKMKSTEIDLGVVQNRFLYISNQNADGKISKAQLPLFRTLVKKASEEEAKKDFAAAFATLEELCRALGQPQKSSHSLKNTVP